MIEKPNLNKFFTRIAMDSDSIKFGQMIDIINEKYDRFFPNNLF